jgi:hypothetical protein
MDRPGSQHLSEELPAMTRPRAVYSIDQILGTSTTSVDEGHLHQSKDGKSVRVLWLLQCSILPSAWSQQGNKVHMLWSVGSVMKPFSAPHEGSFVGYPYGCRSIFTTTLLLTRFASLWPHKSPIIVFASRYSCEAILQQVESVSSMNIGIITSIFSSIHF